MFDSGVSVQFWYYAVVHAVLIYNILTMARNKNDQEQDKTVGSAVWTETGCTEVFADTFWMSNVLDSEL